LGADARCRNHLLIEVATSKKIERSQWAINTVLVEVELIW
jgi:hypothetical protein